MNESIMKGFSVATVAVFFSMTSHAIASGSDLESWEDFSPSGAKRFCEELAVSHEEKNKDAPFVSLLLSRSSEHTEQLRELLDVSENRARLVEILISIGTKEQVVALWGDVSEVMNETPNKEWAWNLPATAVMCSNEKIAEHIFDQGFDPISLRLKPVASW